jgi:hypothetical protein
MPPLFILGAVFLLPRRPGGSPSMAPDPVGALLYFGIVALCVLGGFVLAFVSLSRREHPRWLAYLALFLYASSAASFIALVSR